MAGDPYGVDVYSDTGLVDWSKAKPAGCRFEIGKVTEGLAYVNPLTVKQREGAVTAKVGYGGYHFARATAGRPEEQAQWFLDHANIQPWHLAPSLDLEELGSEHVGGTELETFAFEFGMFVTQALKIPRIILYTDLNMLHNQIHVTARLRGLFMLWLAYPTGTQCPVVPGWKQVLWQDSWHAHVPGISGEVDRNRALVPLDSLTVHALQEHGAPAWNEPNVTVRPGRSK